MSHFFREMQSFGDFAHIMNDGVYTKAPSSWTLVIADIRGSTRAIQEGRYRDVNMVGASVIAAIVNSLPEIHVPFVFGGDGATLLLPPQSLEKAIVALQGSQRVAKFGFDFELRVGLVPLQSLEDQGYELEIAKYEVSPGNYLAMFRGGALQKGEEWVKSGDPRAQLLKFEEQNPPPNFTGLSCRWEPCLSRRGQMLSFLVQSRLDKQSSKKLYGEIVEQIKTIIGTSLHTANPVHARNLKGKTTPSGFKNEIRLHHGQEKLWKIKLQLLFTCLVNHCIFTFNIPAGFFRPKKYKEEMVANADFKKFDDTLRMVLDCGHDEAARIVKYLEDLYQKQQIYYGTHSSNEALMTCFIENLRDGKHLHFIDGAQGGYAMAAYHMKQQMKR